MAKFSIMLFGIDSYTKENLYLPYKLEARNANAAVDVYKRQAIACALRHNSSSTIAGTPPSIRTSYALLI